MASSASVLAHLSPRQPVLAAWWPRLVGLSPLCSWHKALDMGKHQHFPLLCALWVEMESENLQAKWVVHSWGQLTQSQTLLSVSRLKMAPIIHVVSHLGRANVTEMGGLKSLALTLWPISGEDRQLWAWTTQHTRASSHQCYSQ